MDFLGIKLYSNNDDIVSFSKTLYITDEEYLSYIKEYKIPNVNLSLNNIYLQNQEVSLLMREYFYKNDIKNQIIYSNIYKNRYNNNNDVFIHVRLSDATQWNQGFEYYDRVLSSLKFDNGYISSDSPNHKICLNLILKYNLKLVYMNEEHTIMFGSTNKYIVLSHGSFSFIIGLLAFYSDIYYPIYIILHINLKGMVICMHLMTGNNYKIYYII